MAEQALVGGNAHPGAFNLALLYSKGMGVVQDLVMAYVWMNVAVANGYPYSKPRDKVLEWLTDSERRLAVKLSRICLKKPASCPKYSN